VTAGPAEYLVIAFPDGNVSDEIGPGDIGLAGAEPDPGPAAAVLLAEDLRAAPRASALDRNGGGLPRARAWPGTSPPGSGKVGL
jgi:hypothetical protein